MRKRHNKRNLKIQEARKLQKPPANMVSELDRKKPIKPIIDTPSSGRGSCTCSCVYESGGDEHGSSEWPSSPSIYYPIINSTNCGAGYLPLGECPCTDPGGCACDCQCIDDPMTAPGGTAQQGPGAYVNRDNPSNCTCEAWIQPENPEAPRQIIFLESIQMGLNFCPQGVVYDQFHGHLVGRNYYHWSVDPVFDYISDCEGNTSFNQNFWPLFAGQECVSPTSWWCDSDWPSGDDCHCHCSNGQYASSLHDDFGIGGGDCNTDAECGPHCQNWCSTFNPAAESWVCIDGGLYDANPDPNVEEFYQLPGTCPQEEHGCKHICESLPQWQTILNSMSGNVFTMPNLENQLAGMVPPGSSVPLGGPGIPFMISACISGTGNIDIAAGGIIN